LRIKTPAKKSNTQLKLFAANGQLVKAASCRNRNNYLLELPVLAGGVYMLQIVTDKNVYAEKVFIYR
jgi:Secretion system C-terminal sorting domain